MTRLAAVVEDLRMKVEHLRESVDLALAQQPPPSPTREFGRCWRTLTTSQAQHAWAELNDWVDALVERYALDEMIPACWFRHGALVEELHALHLAWLVAYTDLRMGAENTLLWHERFAQSLLRLRSWDRGNCLAGTHQDDTPIGIDEQARTRRAAYVDADVNTRSERRDPHETPMP